MFLPRRLLPVLIAYLGAAGCTLPDGSGSGFCGTSSPAPNIGAWDEAATAFEDRVRELTNERRAAGGCCGQRGCFSASRLLSDNENLRVAARRHARDMADRSFFAHESPDGGTLGDRLRAAGFAGCSAGENIARGQRTPEEVVAGWMASDGHCVNILTRGFGSIGVGYVDDPDAELRRVWVQNFGD